jgi:hypothetical protein
LRCFNGRRGDRLVGNVSDVEIPPDAEGSAGVMPSVLFERGVDVQLDDHSRRPAGVDR